MRHPTIADWTDHARAIADTGDRSAMQSHLEAGCDPCRKIVAALECIMTTAEIDSAITPSAGVIRSVKAFFDLQRPETESRWSDLALRPAFDSALAPLTASRSSNAVTRQVLFESDDCTLELSVDYSPGTVDAVLRGQLLEAHGEPRSHTPVFLVSDGEVISRAISGPHGTFEMCGRMDQTCELWVLPDDENRIRLSLKPEH